jgi:hypothetical protein
VAVIPQNEKEGYIKYAYSPSGLNLIFSSIPVSQEEKRIILIQLSAP